MTERQIEELLQPETRTLTAPSGITFAVTGTKVFWRNTDNLFAYWTGGLPAFLRIVEETAATDGKSLPENFMALAQHACQRLCNEATGQLLSEMETAYAQRHALGIDDHELYKAMKLLRAARSPLGLPMAEHSLL